LKHIPQYPNVYPSLSLIETYPTLSYYFSQCGINIAIKHGIILDNKKDSSSENVCPQNIME
jgi:hypothetical protein